MQDSFQGVKTIACAGEASAVLERGGRLWMWGTLEGSGESRMSLPTPKTAHGSEPVPCISRHQKDPQVVPDLDPVTDVALGKNHVLAITSTS